jgi:hypothetical protein
MWPNLDLIRVLRIISRENGIHRFRLTDQDWWNCSYLTPMHRDRLNHFLFFILQTSRCMTSGNHGIFQQ